MFVLWIVSGVSMIGIVFYRHLFKEENPGKLSQVQPCCGEGKECSSGICEETESFWVAYPTEVDLASRGGHNVKS